MKKIIIITFFLTYALLAFYRRILLGAICLDIDEYMLQFRDYIAIGYYNKVSEGTSIVYNIVLSWFYFFLNNVAKSFYCLNVISQVLIGLIGFWIIKNNNSKGRRVLLLFGVYYILLWINDEQHTLSRNDIFLGVLMMLVYYIIFIKQITKTKSLLLGVILALMISTRLFSVILFPSVFVFLLLNNHENKIKKAGLTFLIFLTTFLLLNYPSIKEHRKLSFYDKNKNISENAGFSWNDINTLATLRMFDEDKVELLTKNMYWGWNKQKVEFYKKKYKIDKSPSSIFEFIVSYPIYYLKLVGLNILDVLLYFFRRYSFLLFLPFIYMCISIKEHKIKFIKKKVNIPFLMFLTSISCLILILNTVIEFRWLISIEFLIIYSIYMSYQKLLGYSTLKTKMNYILMASLLCLTLFNIRTLISIL